MSVEIVEHKEMLAREGWVLADERQPGIYVRSPEAEERNPLDWDFEPEKLEPQVEDVIEHIRLKYQIGGE